MSDDSTKNRIVAAAGPIFASKGFKGSTVREICDLADVNIASINYYFGDKKNLYLQTVIAAREARVQEYPRPSWDHTTTAESKLRDFVEMQIDRLVATPTEPWQLRLLMREILEPTEACRQLVQEYFRPVFEQLLVIVDELAERKLAEDERNKVGFSIVGQCLFYRFAAGITPMFLGATAVEPFYSKSFLAKHIFDFSLAAIKNLPKLNRDGLRPNGSPHFIQDSKINEQV